MNGLNELVYQVTQHSHLLQEIVSNPSLLHSYTNLSSEQIDAFFKVVSNSHTLEHLQSLAPQVNGPVFWRSPWVGM